MCQKIFILQHLTLIPKLGWFIYLTDFYQQTKAGFSLMLKNKYTPRFSQWEKSMTMKRLEMNF